MLKRLVLSVLVVLALVTTASAQEKKPTAAKEKTASKTETTHAPQPPAQPVNIRIDLTITDQRGDAPAIVKAVSLITADQSWGRIRTQGIAQPSRQDVVLNVDARPVLIRDGSAHVQLTFDYKPADQSPTAAAPLNINESLEVVLQDGKSMLLSQSADPIGDRKVTVEAKMTILR